MPSVTVTLVNVSLTGYANKSHKERVTTAWRKLYSLHFNGYFPGEPGLAGVVY